MRDSTRVVRAGFPAPVQGEPYLPGPTFAGTYHLIGDPARADQLLAWRKQMGATPGPMEVWLAHRSLATLDVRLERQCGNALAIAEFLTTRPDVQGVRYPGLVSDPAHAVAGKQMQRFGPVVSFALLDRTRAERFLGTCHLVWEATSFGSVHTTAERRARWGGDGG